MTATATINTICSLMLDTFESELYDRMYQDEDDYIRECLLDSVSPIIRIDYHNGIVLAVNRDDYGHNAIIRMIHDYGNEASVYIDEEDIMYWE